MSIKELKISIPSSQSEYPIIIGQNISQIASPFLSQIKGKILVITDQNVNTLYRKNFENLLNKNNISDFHFLVFPAGEKTKSFSNVKRACQFLIQNNYARDDFLIALGGGVIGDLTGFIASITYRGIKFVQFPTTLLSQIDASVGGKTAINFMGKNLVGSFYHPQKVFIDISFLDTLTLKDLYSGYAEGLKHGLIADQKYWNDFSSIPPEKMGAENLIKFIQRSCEIKSSFVSQDEKENKGPRMALNFGHTIGHALELVSNYENYTHGEAVALGMIAESYLSTSYGLSQSSFSQIYDRLKKLHFNTYTKLNPSKIKQALLRDKKIRQGKINWTLLSEIGKVKVKVTPKSEEVSKAINFITK